MREVGDGCPGPSSHWAEGTILGAGSGLTDGALGGRGNAVWGSPDWAAGSGVGCGTPAGLQSHALPQRTNQTL